MLRLVSLPHAVEPLSWNIVFHPIAAAAWMNRLPIGRFKHVSAFAYLAGLKGWIIYDVQLSKTRVIVLPDLDASLDVIAKLTDGCDIIRMERNEVPARWIRLGFWCVPAVKHLIGLRSGALRPDTLRRDCLRNGGTVVHESPAIPSWPGRRPGPVRRTEASGAG